jgi:transcriptional regulator with XRE-family HTH domain
MFSAFNSHFRRRVRSVNDMASRLPGAGAQRTGLGEFLRARRGKITPEQAGLTPKPTVRRVPGLRREEVAKLAGVSVDYYIQLERGRGANASEAVLDAIARALRLTDDERSHLFTVARPGRTRSQVLPPQRVRPGLHRLLETMTDIPALVIGRCTNILAANRLARALYVDFDALPQYQRNMARFVFFDEAARTLLADWERMAQSMVAALRLHAGRHPHDPQLVQLVAELSARDPDFPAWWADHDINRLACDIKHFHHPLVGDLTLHYETLNIVCDPDQALGVYTAEPATPSEQALRMLADRI